MSEIQIGNFTISKASDDKERLAAIFWGKAGDGKTTLAATARGNKLWLQFDDSGTASIKGLQKQVSTKPQLDTALHSDIYVLDFSAIDRTNWVAKFDQADAFGITPFLTDPAYGIKTVVVDSLTSLGNDVLNYSIKYLGFKNSTIHKPGLEAYGARLNYLKAFISNLLKLTKRFNLDIIFISHEGAPDKDRDSGAVVETTLALGGNLPNETALQVGEVWYIRNSQSNGREIFITPFQHYRPMKTRMFLTGPNAPKTFKWLYDVSNPDPKYELRTWVDQWDKSGYQKQELPK
jgi:hypothetical protein